MIDQKKSYGKQEINYYQNKNLSIEKHRFWAKKNPTRKIFTARTRGSCLKPAVFLLKHSERLKNISKFAVSIIKIRRIPAVNISFWATNQFV
jgi:hypothetical protein